MTPPLNRVPSQSKGFSLLEMLVALVILSFSLGALYQSATAAIRNLAIAEEYTRAIMLAESMLTSVGYVSEAQLAISGTFDVFNWEARSWPAEPSDTIPEDSPIQGQPLQYLEVTVRWAGGATDREISLLTVVPLQGLTE